jgi:hypothetical protein
LQKVWWKIFIIERYTLGLVIIEMDASESKKKRRSKMDNEGRVYSCDCGKSYFSYQALYTHKKTKHLESAILEERPKKKRGRPKRTKEDSENEDVKEEEVVLDAIARKMKKFSEIETPAETCDEAFAEYLVVKQRKLGTNEAFQAIKSSVYYLRDCVNRNYEKVDPAAFLGNEVDYTSTEKPAMIPNVCNYYMLEYLPKEKETFDKDKEIEFMLDFCKWLNEKNYTDLEIAVTP